MPLLDHITAHFAMHLAALIGVAALALRNQLRLRLVLVVSIAISIDDHYFGESGPQWDGLIWDVVTLAVNVWALSRLVLDQTHIGMADEELTLFRSFDSLSPGEFRHLLRMATWKTATEPVVLTEEGARPDHLYYVLDGTIRLVKSGRESTIAAGTFIGEVALLKNRPASATVTIEPGSRYLQWSTMALHRCFEKRQAMRVAVTRLLSADMAMKVARA